MQKMKAHASVRQIRKQASMIISIKAHENSGCPRTYKVRAINLPNQRGYHSEFLFLLQSLELPAKQYMNKSSQN